MKKTAKYYKSNPKAAAKKKAYDKKYQASPEQKKNRAKRGRDRYKAEKAGRVSKGDGKVLDHVNGIKGSKTRVTTRSKNAGRREKSRLKGSTRRKRS